MKELSDYKSRVRSVDSRQEHLRKIRKVDDTVDILARSSTPTSHATIIPSSTFGTQTFRLAPESLDAIAQVKRNQRGIASTLHQLTQLTDLLTDTSFDDVVWE
eukprot:c19423_g1_i7.p1 GENE.c19423_g1_i7~~c19423_g1_i7.p1  ORF type:complete len:103 (+),score=22.00 c19423_g1_i7:542-850(+)